MILASVSVISESANYEALLECAVILNGKSFLLSGMFSSGMLK